MRGLSIRAYLVGLVLLAGVPMAALVVYHAVDARDAAVQQAAVRLMTTVNSVTKELGNDIREAERLLSALAEVPSVRRAEQPACARLLADFVRRAPRYNAIAVATRDGTVVCSSQAAAGPVSVADRDYFKEMLVTRAAAVGRPVIGRISNVAALPIAQPVLDPAGEVDKVVVTGISLERASAHVMALPGFAELVFTIWDERGKVLFRHPDNEKWIGTLQPDAWIVKAFAASKGSNSVEAVGLDGVLRVYALATMDDFPRLGLTFSAGDSKQDLIAEADRALRNDLGLLALVFGAALAAAWLLGEVAIRRRVAALAQAASHIAAGRLETRIGGPHRGGELGLLGGAFDNMAAAMQRQVADIRRAEEDLRRLNVELEQRVTERTAELEQANARIESVLEGAPDAMAAFDPELRYIQFNTRYRDHTRRRSGAEIVPGAHLHDAFAGHPDLLARIESQWRRALAGESFSAVRTEGDDPDTRLVFEITYRPMRDAQGAVRGVVNVVRDITERMRSEENLRAQSAEIVRQNRELERASRAKSDFLANMSHELRTPLNSIIGFSEMLKDGVLGELEAKQRGFIADIFDAGTHLLSLINDILDLAKVEAGMLQLELRALDVAALLKTSLLVVREKAATHRIRLDTRLAPALGEMLADERKLKQIVYNLLSNAVKFSPDGGAVTLTARRCARAEVALDPALPAGRLIALPPGEAGEFLAITVEDTGVGIAEDDLARLFEPFSQVDSSIARRHAGTGLGLSLVRRLAELHGGTVGVSSRVGAGSAFSVWLPHRKAAPVAQEGRAAPEGTVPAVLERAATSTAMASIPSMPTAPLALVVEDDDRMAGIITGQLRADGFQVMRASTAEEGLVRAAKSRPQLITLDIFLPSMDGWEFMRRLKADPALADTPVVIITVSKDHEHGIALGARRVLHKPFAREELVAALAGFLDARPDGEAARVLVVDDNVQAVELVAAALGSAGYRVLRAYGGAEAIEAARSHRPDLVILDLLMPGVSGFEVAQALRESEVTAHIPILVLTAKDLSAQDRARLDGSVSAILAKSGYSHDALLAELRRAIAARKPD